MKLTENKEILLPLGVMLGLGAAATAVCFMLDLRCGLVCAALTLAVCAVFTAFSIRRIARIRALSESLDKMIDGAMNIDLASYAEGELGILHNQLSKLTVRLAGHASELKKDKLLLADSIADISHQIRTPLTAINLISAALNEPGVGRDKHNELLSQLNIQLSKIDWLVSSLLKLAKLDADSVSMDRESVPLAQLIADALSPIAIQMEIRGQTAVAEASGCAVCDASWTAEALTNVFKNCSEHMGAGALLINASENPLYSEIVIRDQGHGIDKKDLPHIFERFYKGKNSSDNSVGIGLALSRSIITRQNGSIKADNDPSGGARFTVRIYKSAV